MNRNRLTLVFIAALFGLPLIAAWLMQSGLLDWRPAQTVNLGRLVSPPLPLDIADWQATDTVGSNWRILYVVPRDCDATCTDQVIGLRQVHLAAGRHRSQVVVTLLPAVAWEAATREAMLAIHPEFQLVVDPVGDTMQALSLALQRSGIGDANLAGHAFVIDPAANVILAYTAGFNPNHINRDLKRLLTWSAGDE